MAADERDPIDDREERSRYRWLLQVEVALGVWLVGFTLVVAGAKAIVYDDVLVGLIAAVTGAFDLTRVARGRRPQSGLAVVGVLTGLWLLAFSLQYPIHSVLLWNSVAVGGLLVLVNLAYYRMNRQPP